MRDSAVSQQPNKEQEVRRNHTFSICRILTIYDPNVYTSHHRSHVRVVSFNMNDVIYSSEGEGVIYDYDLSRFEMYG